MREKLKTILMEHKGKSNRITSSQIARCLGINEDDTHAKTRSLIFDVAEEYKIPLAADAKGYYVIATKEEYQDYMNNLDRRIAGIDRRKMIISNNYYGGQQ